MTRDAWQLLCALVEWGPISLRLGAPPREVVQYLTDRGFATIKEGPGWAVVELTPEGRVEHAAID